MDVERTSTGDIKYPEDIWKAARPIARGYDQAMAISALLLAERQRCAALCHASAAQSQEIYPAGQDRGIARAVADNIAKAIEEGTKP